VRLSISGACFPAFPVNPGTGCPLYLANGMESLVTTIVLWSHDSLPSRLWLPIAG
jgi:predicted acyl esterase